MGETSAFLEEIGRVVLNASGGGSVTLRPSNAHERWVITSTVVRTTPNTGAQSACTTFVGAGGVVGGTAVDTTYTGNNDSSDTRIEINTGSVFTAVWTGGNPVALASVTVTGERIQRR